MATGFGDDRVRCVLGEEPIRCFTRHMLQRRIVPGSETIIADMKLTFANEGDEYEYSPAGIMPARDLVLKTACFADAYSAFSMLKITKEEMEVGVPPEKLDIPDRI